MTDPVHFPDPAGVFATDTHRRVMAHLPPPDDEAVPLQDLFPAIQIDPTTPISEEEPLAEILNDLEADGYAKQYKADLWKQSKEGHETLNGPVRNYPVEVDGEVQMGEPPPLEGARLEEAERRNAEEKKAAEEAAAQALIDRVDQLKEGLVEAEEEAAA